MVSIKVLKSQPFFFTEVAQDESNFEDAIDVFIDAWQCRLGGSIEKDVRGKLLQLSTVDDDASCDLGIARFTSTTYHGVMLWSRHNFNKLWFCTFHNAPLSLFHDPLLHRQRQQIQLFHIQRTQIPCSKDYGNADALNKQEVVERYNLMSTWIFVFPYSKLHWLIGQTRIFWSIRRSLRRGYRNVNHQQKSSYASCHLKFLEKM